MDEINNSIVFNTSGFTNDQVGYLRQYVQGLCDATGTRVEFPLVLDGSKKKHIYLAIGIGVAINVVTLALEYGVDIIKRSEQEGQSELEISVTITVEQEPVDKIVLTKDNKEKILERYQQVKINVKQSGK
jgi:hypothetical protein